MVKEKPNSTRIYDKDGFRRRAACICVRSDAEAEVFCFFDSNQCHCHLNNTKRIYVLLHLGFASHFIQTSGTLDCTRWWRGTGRRAIGNGCQRGVGRGRCYGEIG